MIKLIILNKFRLKFLKKKAKKKFYFRKKDFLILDLIIGKFSEMLQTDCKSKSKS